MTLVFYSRSLNHHQVYVADCMYEALGKNFIFVTTIAKDRVSFKGGVDYSTRPYCIDANISESNHKMGLDIAVSADVCVFGVDSQEYAVHRAKHNSAGLSFEIGERWLKKGLINVLSPRLCSLWLNYIRYYRKANFYKLCASAFTANDDVKLGCYKGRHYKWGYFTKVEELRTDSLRLREQHSKVRLMWCARFIDWKHPELAVQCAERLNAEGYKFELHMYGDGVMREAMEQKVGNLGLGHIVKLFGNVPNKEIRKAMRESDIFLFTSDKEEGWGAVANEAMSAGCCLVGSDEIGAVPYLVTSGENGLIYRSCDIDDMVSKVKFLLGHPIQRVAISKNAISTMQDVWSPENAVNNLFKLVNGMLNNTDADLIVGPCSKESI